ncbi:MAG: molybdopterin-binding protein [Flavobacteriales bacterium]|nr:MAG: molybdopterin-binding protein [Flavobacteriales bacterium]
MKYLFYIFLLYGLNSQAQESKQFTVEGEVKTPMTVNLDMLKNFTVVSLDSIPIYNHRMQRKSNLRNVKGIALKELLSKLEIIAETPTVLSEYYLVCTATDNYKVVLSWNEVFNSKTSNNFLILTDFDPDPAKAEKGNIALIAPGDEASGRRFVKGLSKIAIYHAN